MGFEGSEHLYSIISEIKDLIDYIIVGVQNVSYHNEPISDTDKLIIEDLAKQHLIDKVIYFDLDLNKLPREQETDKRNLIIENAELAGCSHILVIDSDEFYTHSNFEYAKNEIEKHNYDITYCQYINYYKDYMHYMKYPFKDGMYVPFIARTSYRHKFDCTDFNRPSDPTRRFVRYKDKDGKPNDVLHVFEWKEIRMHHLSWVRNNIYNKIQSWSSKTLFQNAQDLIDQATYDFEHFSDDTKKVHLLFNTPDHTVDIVKFDKQYIFPKSYDNKFINTPEIKKIVVLNMSCTGADDLHILLEKVCRETWAKDILNKKYNNIRYFSVIDTDDVNHIDFNNNMIYVHKNDTDDNYSHLVERFIVALDILKKENIEYDYIIKTNTSTWLNIPFINEFLSLVRDNSVLYGFRIESAFWSTFNLYLQGNLTIFSKKHINLLRQINFDKYKNLNIADDCLFGSILSNRNNYLNIPQIDKIKVLPSIYYTEYNSSFTDYTTDYAAIQVKSVGKDKILSYKERIEYDIPKMYEIHKLYTDQTNSLSIDYHIRSIQLHNILKEQTGYYIHLINDFRQHWIDEVSALEKQNIQYQPLQYFENWDTLWATINQLKEQAGYK